MTEFRRRKEAEIEKKFKRVRNGLFLGLASYIGLLIWLMKVL
jgi:hypothetical protein